MRRQIGTHDGKFHCDEVFAVWLLKQCEAFRNHDVVRFSVPRERSPYSSITRDPNILAECDVLVDVGDEYDRLRRRFDHHQIDFSHTADSLGAPNLAGFSTPLSSAGLVYIEYGLGVVAKIIGDGGGDSKATTAIYRELYRSYVQVIDAVDNGKTSFDAFSGGISTRISRLNPHWNDGDLSPQRYDTCFQEAIHLLDKDVRARLHYLHNVWWPARTVVLEAYEKRHSFDRFGRILVLPHWVPFKQHLFQLQPRTKPEILFVVYKEIGTDRWHIDTLPENDQMRKIRLLLPTDWHGKRGVELTRVTRIPGCEFVDKTGRVAGANTRETAIAMAKEALSLAARCAHRQQWGGIGQSANTLR